MIFMVLYGYDFYLMVVTFGNSQKSCEAKPSVVDTSC